MLIINKEDFRSAYKAYCKKNRVKELDDRAIKNILNHAGIIEERISLEGSQVRVWKGLKLRISQDSQDKIKNRENIIIDEKDEKGWLSCLDNKEHIQTSQPSQGSHPFSPYMEKSNLAIGSNTMSTLATLANSQLIVEEECLFSW